MATRLVPTMALVIGLALAACDGGQGPVDAHTADGSDVTLDVRSDVVADGNGPDVLDDLVMVDGSSADTIAPDATDDAGDATTTIDGSVDGTSANDANVDAGPDADAMSTLDAAMDASPDVASDASATGSCMAACDHVFTCTGATCIALGVDCASSPPDPCVSDCVAAMPCASLTPTTVTACNAMCAGDAGVADAGSETGTDAATSDAGSPAACQSCTINTCAAPASACVSDPTCSAWIGCVSACSTSACVDACDTQYAGAASLYHSLYACQCTSCPSECGYADPCSR